MTWPSEPADYLSLDAEQQADLLLAGLATCGENERGRNFILFSLGEWFSDLTSGVGNPSTFPDLQAQRDEAIDALDDAYALLESRGLIRPDPSAGSTFCKLTRAGQAEAASAELPDAARVAFARRALEGIEVHKALSNRQVDAHFRGGKFETALRDGSTFLEGAIRTLSDLDPKLVGVKLASTAFAPAGPLADPNAPVAEQVGVQNLYVGFFGAIRNKIAHRDFKLASDKKAFESFMLLDYLTEVLAEAATRSGKPLS
jgi:hypothetical protein